MQLISQCGGIGGVMDSILGEDHLLVLLLLNTVKYMYLMSPPAPKPEILIISYHTVIFINFFLFVNTWTYMYMINFLDRALT